MHMCIPHVYGMYTQVRVTDVWSGKALGEHVGRFTMEKVGYHDTALLRLSVA